MFHLGLRNRSRGGWLAPAALLLGMVSAAWAGPAPMPKIVHRDGHYALFVDGAPYLMLGAQVNNSSAWPAMLPKVWPAIADLHANTVEMPVYWEQMEPRPGQFDFSVVDTLLRQARAHHVHLVLLWFGTWKNGSGHYQPIWMKLHPRRYPRVIGRNGQVIDSPSPFAWATRAADARAFAALMGHLKTADAQHTVLMVQVENETGTWGSVRDFSAAAEKRFNAPVPERLLAALKLQAAPGADWQTVFGVNADEFFQAWSVARYVQFVAAAGRKVNPLPLYVNAQLRDPLHPSRPPAYESGGPTDNVLGIWKAAAPDIAVIGPDIYLPGSQRYLKVLDLYDRPDNPMFVPETADLPANARFFFSALDHGAIGFSPFGMDYTGYANYPLGARAVTPKTFEQFALNYRLVRPMDRLIARLEFEGKLEATAETRAQHRQELDFGHWRVLVSYGLPPFGPGRNPPGNATPVGRALVARLGPGKFLVAGFFCRVDFEPSAGLASAGRHRQYLRVEQVRYQHGFHNLRIWNGDQTDWGLNFRSAPQVLVVRVGTY